MQYIFITPIAHSVLQQALHCNIFQLVASAMMHSNISEHIICRPPNLRLILSTHAELGNKAYLGNFCKIEEIHLLRMFHQITLPQSLPSVW